MGVTWYDYKGFCGTGLGVVKGSRSLDYNGEEARDQGCRPQVAEQNCVGEGTALAPRILWVCFVGDAPLPPGRRQVKGFIPGTHQWFCTSFLFSLVHLPNSEAKVLSGMER